MKTIIEMARAVGLEEMWELTPRFIGRLEAFATLVRADLYKEMNDPLVLMCKQMVADEREACAKVCEEQEYHYWRATEDQDFTPQDCANAIRARGNT